jgi:hypothetical protein
MGRRKKTDEIGQNGEQNGVAVLEEPPVTETNGEPPKNKPVATFASNSDRTTRIEVAVWARIVKVNETEEYTQYSITINRSWRSDEGVWSKSGFFRIHDIPVQMYLIQQAYNWCLCQRLQVSIASDEEMPF